MVGTRRKYWKNKTQKMIETQIYVCQKDNVFKGSNLAHLLMPSLSLDPYSQEANTFQLYFLG